MQPFSLNLIFLTMVLALLVVNLQLHLASAAIGVNYGMLGDNLPEPSDVVFLYMRENIPIMRLFEPKLEVLGALEGSSIRVSLGVKNEDLTSIAYSVAKAMEWVNKNVVAYVKDVNFGWITVGNEMVPGPYVELIPQAMNNIQSALYAANLINIKVSTVVSIGVLGNTYPPSAGDFTSEASGPMRGIITWLAGTNNPLFVNVYPYLAYVSDPTHIPLDYALFNSSQPVIDGQYKYFSLFEAMVDSFYAALEKNGGANVTLVVSETGWPSAGNEPYTNKENAQTYNQKLIDKMKLGGTPRRPTSVLDVLIFAMFNENQKPSGFEQNWGIHYPNKEPVYPLTF